MSFVQKIAGDATNNVAEVTANKRLKVDLETNAATNPTQVGGVRIFSEADNGVVTGAPTLLSPESTADFRLRVGTDQSLFNLAFEGTNIARDRIQQNDTTATSAQAASFLTINSGASVTSGQGSFIRTYRTFPIYGTYPLYAEFWVKEQNITATNSITEYGLGYCSGVTAQLTDGVLLRRISGGQLRLIIVNNSVDILSQDITETNIPPRDGAGTFSPTEVYHAVLAIHNDEVLAWINDTLVARLSMESTIPAPTNASAQPLFARVYMNGTASAARQLSIGYLNVSLGDQQTNKPWGHALCGMGGNIAGIQPGTASAPSVSRGATAAAGWPNSTQARAAGTWTATSAPATASLGGQWVSPAISTLTSEADYPVFAYLNPAGSATVPGKTMYITFIQWGRTVVGAAASTNGISLQYIIGVGATAAATSTSDGAATVGYRALVLDNVAFKSTAVAYDTQEGGFIDCGQAPLVVPPGCYVSFIVRPYGTVTSNTLTVNGTVSLVGYYE